MRNTEISHILRAATETPWAILPQKLVAIRAFFEARINGAEISAMDREAMVKQAEDRQQYKQQGSVAVVPVFGTISQRVNMMSALSGGGGTSTELLGKQIRDAVADSSISAIVLNVDSPGGTVSGLPELHSEILSARESKPVVASINSMSASAAYWLTSACNEVCCTISGEAGSIGVFAMHEDLSAAAEMEGVKVTYISAGRFKTEGNPFEPLSDEARAQIQSDVDKFYSMFVRDVAKGRGISVSDVKANFGEGRMLLASDAKAAGMVDRIETLDQTVSRLSRTGKFSNSRKAAAIQTEMAGKFS